MQGVRYLNQSLLFCWIRRILFSELDFNQPQSDWGFYATWTFANYILLKRNSAKKIDTEPPKIKTLLLQLQK